MRLSLISLDLIFAYLSVNHFTLIVTFVYQNTVAKGSTKHSCSDIAASYSLAYQNMYLNNVQCKFVHLK